MGLFSSKISIFNQPLIETFKFESIFFMFNSTLSLTLDFSIPFHSSLNATFSSLSQHF
jgi:hypothetical protein